jgi:CMP-N-acetylneuraminic acid synthetase
MILGIIPARAGSKGIKDKNNHLLNEMPLIEYTVDVVCHSCLRNSYVITTNDENILKRHEGCCELIRRPHELCEDDTPMFPVIQHAINIHEKYTCRYVDAICLLQPTSPLRTTKDIDRAISIYDGTSLYSGYYMRIKTKDKLDSKNNPRHFQRNGAIFIASRELIEQGKLWDENVIEFEMPFSRSIDIDTMEDMFIAESLIKNGGLK